MNDTNSGIVRAAVVGVGAIGGLLAMALSKAGMTVSAYARGATLDALNAHGVRVIDETGVVSSVPVRASDDAAVLGVQDYVVIALKAQALPALAARIAPLVGPDTVIVAAMNGLPWWFTHGPRRAGRRRAARRDRPGRRCFGRAAARAGDRLRRAPVVEHRRARCRASRPR